MFRNRIFKVLSFLVLLMVLCTGQVAAAPSNSTDEVTSLNSPIPISGDLTPISKFAKLDLPSTNTFTGSASIPGQITFTSTGNMSVTRVSHTTTLLNNGMVLAVGGWDEAGYAIASAELFDPSTGTWSTTGSMSVVRPNHTATLLNNGKVLVAGGGVGVTLSSAELYDPATGTWSITGSMNVPRSSWHTATLLSNGKVLVAGGDNGSKLASAELYDSTTGTWSITGNMSVARSSHTAALLTNGKVLVAGGFGIGNSALASAELYDPNTGTWSVTGSMNIARFSYSQNAALLNIGKVLVAGGLSAPLDSLSSVELYNPSTGTWSTTGNMNITRSDHTVILLNRVVPE